MKHIRRSVSHPTRRSAAADDRRVRRTHDRLAAAFSALLLEQSYDRITVTDIATRADVGRATFYAHYPSKDALLRDQLARLAGALVLRDADGQSPSPAGIPDATPLFAHVRDAFGYYRALMLGPSSLEVSRALTDAIATRVRSCAQPASRRDDRDALVSPELRAYFVASTLLSLIAWWVDGNMRQTPDRLQLIYQALLSPSHAK